MTIETGQSARAPGVALDGAAHETARLALLSMLAEGPVHRIAMRDAARRAGVGLATLYKYFGGKDAMVLAVLQPELDAEIDALNAASRREVGVKARFRAVLEASITFARDHRDAARAIVLNLPAGVFDDAEAGRTVRRRAIMVHILKNGMRDGSVRSDVEAEVLSDLVFGALTALIEPALRQGEPIDPPRLGARAYTALWPAVSAT